MSGPGMQRYRLEIGAMRGSALTLLGIPAGAQISDGTRSVAIAQANSSLDLNRWKHDELIFSSPEDCAPPRTLRMLVVNRQDGKITRDVHGVALTLVHEKPVGTVEQAHDSASATIEARSGIGMRMMASLAQTDAILVLNHEPIARPAPREVDGEDVADAPNIDWGSAAGALSTPVVKGREKVWLQDFLGAGHTSGDATAKSGLKVVLR